MYTCVDTLYIYMQYIHTYIHTHIHTYNLYMDNNAEKSDFRLTAAVNNHQAELTSEGSGLSCLRVLRF